MRVRATAGVLDRASTAAFAVRPRPADAQRSTTRAMRHVRRLRKRHHAVVVDERRAQVLSVIQSVVRDGLATDCSGGRVGSAVAADN